MDLPQDVYDRLTDIHNSLRGHVGLKLCKRRLKRIRKQRVEDNLEPDAVIPDRMIKLPIDCGYRQCPYCEITNRFTCASYNPFEVLHLDHIGPLTKDTHGVADVVLTEHEGDQASSSSTRKECCHTLYHKWGVCDIGLCTDATLFR